MYLKHLKPPEACVQCFGVPSGMIILYDVNSFFFGLISKTYIIQNTNCKNNTKDSERNITMLYLSVCFRVFFNRPGHGCSFFS